MKLWSEIVLALAVLLVLLFKVDPFHWFMPDAVQMLLLCLFAAAFALYAGVIFREKPQDERESAHLYRASRVGYLVGVISLSLVFVIKDILGIHDPWTVGILALMIITKLAVLKYDQHRH